MGKKQKKKEKITYIDDGSSVADMSALDSKDGQNKPPRTEAPGRTRAPLKEQFKTFFDAQRMMFLPMLAVLGIIALAFLLVYLIL